MIEAKHGKPVKYPRDCEVLAIEISSKCNCHISASTIKRLYGLLKGSDNHRIWTLDVIANYLGFSDWNLLLNHLVDGNPKKPARIEFVDCKKLKKGIRYRLSFGKTVTISLEFIGKNNFFLVEQNRTTLTVGDVIEIENMRLDSPLLVKRIKRGSTIRQGIILGSVTGLTDITELEKIAGAKDLKFIQNESTN